MNICMVGYGAIAQKHMEALRGIGGVRFRSLVGRRPEPTAAFALQWGFERHGVDLQAALDDSGVDAVVITSPNELHVPQAEAALRAGKHVLLEIPIAMRYDEARGLARLSRVADRRLMICHTMRYFPAIREVQLRVASGRLRLHHLVCFFGLMRRTNVTSNGGARSWTDNILWHHGAHLVDMALWTTGNAEAGDVSYRFSSSLPAQGVMDMNLSFTLRGGPLVTIAQSYNLGFFRWRVLYIGEEETLEFDNGSLSDAQGNLIVPARSIVDLRDQDQEFVASVRERRDPAITGEDVLPTMSILEQAHVQALTPAATS